MTLSSRGATLTLLVILIAVSAILAVPTAIHLATELKAVQLRLDRIKAYNMAYAGVMEASYNWVASASGEASRRYSGLENTLSGTVLGYKTGRPANFAYFSFNLSENAEWTNTSGGTTGSLVRLRRFRLRNIHANSAPTSIIATHAKVTWTPDNGEKLSDIRLGNRSVIPSGGPFSSGTLLTLSNTDANRTRSSGQVWSGTSTYLQWDSPLADPVKVTVVWTFKDNDSPAATDSDSHEVIYWDGCKQAADCTPGVPLGRPAVRTFTVTSTGRVDQTSGAGFKVFKTVRATFSGAPAGRAAEIIDWRERDGALI